MELCNEFLRALEESSFAEEGTPAILFHAEEGGGESGFLGGVQTAEGEELFFLAGEEVEEVF